MILNKIYLYPNPADFDREFGSNFLFETSFVTYYINRFLKKLKFQSEDFNKIGICLGSSKDKSLELKDRYLELKVPFDKQKFDQAKDHIQKANYFIDTIIYGIKEIQKQFTVPYNEIENIVEDFRENGYVNEWVFKRKKVAKTQLSFELKCVLDIKQFTLYLNTVTKDDVLKSEKILCTKPDELIYGHKFKDLAIVSNEVVILDKFGDILFQQQIDTNIPY